jgi:uncharacterized protein YggT (Ycf19 family)
MYFVPPNSIPAIIFDAVQLLITLILIDIIISWSRMFGARISSFNPFVRFVSGVVNPVLAPVRRALPPYRTGNWDLSGIIVIFVLQCLLRFLGPL